MHQGKAARVGRRLAEARPFAVAAVALFAVGCSGKGDDDHASGGSAGTAGGSSGQGGSTSGQGGTGGSGNGGSTAGGTGGSSASGGSSGTKSGSGGSSGGSSGTGAQAGDGGSGALPSGGPGCGLDAAAFCDTFDAPAKNRGRAGELDAVLWSASRMAPDGPTATHDNGQAFGVRAATLLPERNGMTLPACRADVGDTVYPDGDTLICDPSPDIASNYLLVAVASQNYGQNSYRVRQPFDFKDRTGKVVFDAEGLAGGLLGWVSLDITEDPIGAPSFQTQMNLEGGVLPRSGLTVQFNAGCAGMDTVGVSEVHVFDDYAETILQNMNPTCVPAAWGKLNHFEISVAQNHVDVSATPFSSDGTSFGDPTVIWSGDVTLPFTRGYVQFTTHNHATLKYSAPGEGFGNGFTNLDAWMARWDNVGFDGPIISNFREYEVADPLGDLTMTDMNGTTPLKSTGFTVADAAMGPSTVLEFDGVDLDGVTKASIALDAWYCRPCVSAADVAKFTLHYRVNGNDWVDRTLNDQEATDLSSGNGRGAAAHVLDIPLEQLVAGKNTIEFLAVDIPQNYPPGIANVDLILQTQ